MDWNVKARKMSRLEKLEECNIWASEVTKLEKKYANG